MSFRNRRYSQIQKIVNKDYFPLPQIPKQRDRFNSAPDRGVCQPIVPWGPNSNGFALNAIKIRIPFKVEILLKRSWVHFIHIFDHCPFKTDVTHMLTMKKILWLNNVTDRKYCIFYFMHKFIYKWIKSLSHKRDEQLVTIKNNCIKAALSLAEISLR